MTGLLTIWYGWSLSRMRMFLETNVNVDSDEEEEEEAAILSDCTSYLTRLSTSNDVRQQEETVKEGETTGFPVFHHAHLRQSLFDYVRRDKLREVDGSYEKYNQYTCVYMDVMLVGNANLFSRLTRFLSLLLSSTNSLTASCSAFWLYANRGIRYKRSIKTSVSRQGPFTHVTGLMVLSM